MTRLKVLIAVVVGVITVLVVGLVLVPTSPRIFGPAYFGSSTKAYIANEGTSLARASSSLRIIGHATANNVDETRRGDRPIRVACVGDSITFRGCVSNANDTYVAQLSRLLGPGYEVTNYGNSGRTMLKQGVCCRAHNQTSPPCSYWNTAEFRASLESSPNIVTIMLGTNDAKRCNWYGVANGSPEGVGKGYFFDYMDMVEAFSSLPSAPQIYLAVPPPLVHPPKHPNNPSPFDMDDRVINFQLPVLVRSVAADFSRRFHTRIGIIDVWSAIGGEKGYEDSSMTCDGCHPTKGANAIIARTFALAIRLQTNSATITTTTNESGHRETDNSS
jgi:lysophospholipase L1-like esterase